LDRWKWIKTQTKIEFDIGDQFGAEYKGHYVVKRYTWATRNRIIEKYTQINPSTGKVINTDKTAVRAELILVSIVQQPSGNPVTLPKLLGTDIESAVPPELIDLIEKHVNSLNRISPEEEKNS
jgi:hypothetical protein